MSIHAAMIEACRAVGIVPPNNPSIGQFVQCPVVGKSRSNKSGRVLIFENGSGGIAWNWAAGGKEQRFSADGVADSSAVRAPQRDPAKARREAEEQRQVVETCRRILNACEQAQHPYLARKGFPDELGLVIDDPRPLLPRNELGEAMTRALPETDGPLLVVPGWIGSNVTTLQFITADGSKKNLLRGKMSGASHRIATGRETWVCEGIATAMTVRAALRLLGRSATVLSAFSASNVAKVAEGIPGALIAADHDKPIPDFGGLGTGEFYARRTGRKWAMPKNFGDFNDLHQSEGLRSVAIHLREFLL